MKKKIADPAKELQQLRTQLAIIKEQFDTQAHDVENLSIENGKLKAKIWQLDNNMRPIDFGTGKLYYLVEKESSAYLNDFVQALKNAALVVPLQVLVRSINNPY